jgi:hypothetical protein
MSKVLITIFFFSVPFMAFANDADDIFAEINRARSANALPPLSVDSRLSEAAFAKAKDLVASGALVHTFAPAGTPWSYVANVGYEYGQAGENLAVSFDLSEVVKDWLASSSHRDNVLSASFKDVGLAIVPGVYENEPANYVAIYFARPQEVQKVQILPTPVYKKVEPIVNNSPAPAPVPTPAPVVTPVTVGAESPDSQDDQYKERIALLNRLVATLTELIRLLQART